MSDNFAVLDNVKTIFSTVTPLANNIFEYVTQKDTAAAPPLAMKPPPPPSSAAPVKLTQRLTRKELETQLEEIEQLLDLVIRQSNENMVNMMLYIKELKGTSRKNRKLIKSHISEDEQTSTGGTVEGVS